MPLPLYGSGGLTFRISAACWPTRCLSMPRTTMVVAFGISKSIPSRGEMTTGCEYPTCKLMSRPCREPRYPTPCIRRVLVKPSVTPVTAFCSRERVSPCIALCSGESEARVSTILPFSSLTSTPQPIEDARYIGLLAVDAPAGPAHTPQAPDRTSPVGVVLELYDELLFRAFSPLRVALYVTLLREDTGHLDLH